MKTPVALPFDTGKFSNIHQLGGIRLGTLDPDFGGPTQAVRVAHVNTGGGLRFVVALDRGGDILDASFNQHNLAYLTDVGIRPPNPAFHHGLDWLGNWAGGLVTTCGPQYIGGPRHEDGLDTSLHGHYSNNPAFLESLINPDPRNNRRDMSLTMIVRDARMFGPVVETCRTIRCTLGEAAIHIDDTVTNRGNQPVAHHWLYHVNLGYPLLDAGAKFIYAGSRCTPWIQPIPAGGKPTVNETLVKRWKTVSAPIAEHSGVGERGLILDPKPDREGMNHVGLVNPKLKLGLELTYPASDLPRLANWQHYGPAGSYVGGIEPFAGSLMGKANDAHPMAERYLKPGESARYRLTIRVLTTPGEISALKKYDGAVTV